MNDLMQSTNNQNSGGCLCGAVQYSIYGKYRNVINCHCSLCRKFHGHYGAYTAINLKNIKINDKKNQLRWYRSKGNNAQRGFCKRCGSCLFWKLDFSEKICVTAGTLDQPTSLKTTTNIYVNNKADYYELDTKLENYERGMKDSI